MKIIFITLRTAENQALLFLASKASGLQIVWFGKKVIAYP